MNAFFSKTYLATFLGVVGSLLLSCSKEIIIDPPKGDLAKAIIEIKPVINIEADRATLVAKIVPKQNNTKVIFEYKSVLNAEWVSIPISTGFAGNDSVEVTHTILNLAENSEYVCRAKADNTGGLSISEEIHFKTSVKKPIIITCPVTEIKVTQATLVTKIVPNGAGTTVYFEYRSQEANEWISITAPGSYSGNDSIEVVAILTGLTPNGKYVFRAKAYNGGGEVLSGESPFQVYDNVRDYDGNYYHTVKIGNQIWLKENLKTTHYANGDAIPNVINNYLWSIQNTGAYCWYNNDPEIGKVYGALYNWYVIANPIGFIDGWHVSKDKEWYALFDFLGGNKDQSKDMTGAKLKESGTKHWKAPNVGATNETEFTALPAGWRSSEDGSFNDLHNDTSYWQENSMGWFWALTYDRYYLSGSGGTSLRTGISIRLIKD